jgi:hypothetical protein
MHPTLRRLDRLAAHVSGDPAVEAVLGLGSAGAETDRFDDHSDIDFFLVVSDRDAKQRYLDDIGWLSGFGGELVYDFVNDPNGRKALFADGLFLEYAVFTAEELPSIPFHAARTVWITPGFTLPEPGPGHRSPLDTEEFHLNEALTNLFVGLHRELRGERLAATRFIQVYAVDRVLALQRLGATTAPEQADPFDPTRRVERRLVDAVLPLERMIPGYEGNIDAAAATLEWLRMHFAPAPSIIAAVEALIEDARAR